MLYADLPEEKVELSPEWQELVHETYTQLGDEGT